MFIEGKLFKILFIKGHIPNNDDGTYSYEIILSPFNENNDNFYKLPISTEIKIIGNKNIFNCDVDYGIVYANYHFFGDPWKRPVKFDKTRTK